MNCVVSYEPITNDIIIDFEPPDIAGVCLTELTDNLRWLVDRLDPSRVVRVVLEGKDDSPPGADPDSRSFLISMFGTDIETALNVDPDEASTFETDLTPIGGKASIAGTLALHDQLAPDPDPTAGSVWAAARSHLFRALDLPVPTSDRDAGSAALQRIRHAADLVGDESGARAVALVARYADAVFPPGSADLAFFQPAVDDHTANETFSRLTRELSEPHPLVLLGRRARSIEVWPPHSIGWSFDDVSVHETTHESHRAVSVTVPATAGVGGWWARAIGNIDGRPAVLALGAFSETPAPGDHRVVLTVPNDLPFGIDIVPRPDHPFLVPLLLDDGAVARASSIVMNGEFSHRRHQFESAVEQIARTLGRLGDQDASNRLRSYREDSHVDRRVPLVAARDALRDLANELLEEADNVTTLEAAADLLVLAGLNRPAARLLFEAAVRDGTAGQRPLTDTARRLTERALLCAAYAGDLALETEVREFRDAP